MKRTSMVVLVVALVGLAGLAGCLPKAVGVAGGPPVDRPAFEQQAATRRAELTAERVKVTADLDAARSKGNPVAVKAAEAVLGIARASGEPVTIEAAEAALGVAKAGGDPAAIEAAEAAVIDHRAATAKFNELYLYGVAELDRQAEANAETFAVLETIGQAGAEGVGMPPGVWQALAGVVFGLAGRAGIVKIRKVKADKLADKTTPGGRRVT